MAENEQEPLLDRASLEEQFGRYEPPGVPGDLPNVPFRGLSTPSPSFLDYGDGEPVSAMKALDAAISSKGGPARGGSIPRSLGELTNPRYNVFVPGDYNNEDAYAQGQSWVNKMVNSVSKGLVLTGTTFLQGTVGLVNGLANWTGTGNFSSFYDNEMNRGLDSLNKKLDEELLPNYYTNVEKNAAWYSPDKLFTANFLWNGIVKNLGYAAGAALSGGVYAAGIKSLSALPGISRLVSVGKQAEVLAATEAGLVGADKVASTYGKIKSLSDRFLSSYNVLNPGGRAVVAGLSTSGEAGFEALQTLNTERDRLIDEHVRANNGVYPTGEALENINRKAEQVGNAAFLLNVGLLTATNYIQFPKILGSSYTAEKGMINSLVRETSDIIEEGGKYIAKPTRGGRVISTLNKIRPYTFSASEAFEEGAQFAIGKGVEDYYRKKDNNEPTSFLESLTEGITQTFGTDEGMENVLIGGLSGAIMLGRGRYREGVEKSRNTAEAIQALNKFRLSDFSKETIDSINRGTALQQEREEFIKKGDILNAKDKEADYIINYLSPRIKFGRFDLVQAELDDYRRLASTDEGFAQLQSEGKALPTDTRQAFTARLDGLQQTANNVKSLYQSINLRYGGRVDQNGKPVYTPAVIDKMVYAASKVADYDVRIPTLTPKLVAAGINVDDVVKDIVDGNVESFNTAMDSIKAMKNINDDQKTDLAEALEDVADMSVRRDSFLKAYNKIKEKPQEFKEYEPAPEEQVETTEAEKKTVKVETKTGEKEIETGTEYFVGKAFDYDKDGLEIPVSISSLIILGENEDGTLKIKDTKTGEIQDVSKKVLANYQVGKVSDLKANKTANYFFKHRNEVFEYNFGKEYGGKKRGRLEYKDKNLFFVYRDDKGKIRRKKIDNTHFIAQEGYTQPRITKVGEVETQEQKNSREEFTSAEEIAKQRETLARNKDARLEIITQLETETRSRLEEVEKKLETKKQDLESIQKDLDKIGDEVKVAEPRTKREKALEAKYPELSRQKAKFSKVLSTTSKALTKLSRMRQSIEDEIGSLTAEKNELELNLAYFQDFSQNLDELPENSGEFLKELKEQVQWIDMLVKETGRNINALSDLGKSVEKTIKEFVSFLKHSLQKFDQEYPDYIKEKMAEIQEGTFVIKNFTDLKEYLADYAMLKDLQKEISVNEKELDDINKEVEGLYNQLNELGAEYNAKKQILDRFQVVADAYQKRILEENKIIQNEQLKAEALGTADTGVQTAEYSTEFEPVAKKSDEIIPRATSGVMRGKAHQIRANKFGFNLDRFENRDNIRGVYITSKNENELIPGLTDRLRVDENGQIDESINKDEIIALVMVEQDAEGRVRLVDENGQPIPEGVNPLDAAVYQVYPDGDLKWGAEFNNESMFRKDTPQEVKDAIIKQYKEWRASVLESTTIGNLHEIGASFGLTDVVRDADGKIDYNTKTSVQDANLITADDLEASQLINIPTLPSEGSNVAIVTKGTTSMRVPVGTVLLETPNGLVKLQNRQHTQKEASTIFDAILTYAKYMLDPKVGTKDPKADRVLNWLKSVVYWGIPEDQQGNRKPAGYNSIFFEKDEETGKLMLTISGKGKDFVFTPSALEANREAIELLINNLYNNINSNMAKQTSEPYEEILSIAEDGTITSRLWKNYQSYLLANTTPDGKTRSGEQLPLSTLIRPAANAEDVNRTGIYFYTTDTADDFVIPVVEKKKVVTPRVLTPGAPTPAAKPAAPTAPSSDIKAKKADIERRRQEELSLIDEDYYLKKGAVVTGIIGEDEVMFKDNMLYRLGGTGVVNGVPNVKGASSISSTKVIKDAVNAKYDAELAALEGAKPTAAPATYTLDGTTPNTYTSPSGKKIKFTASADTTIDNLNEKIKVLVGEDLDEAVKTIEAAGKDPKVEIKKVIFNAIAPTLNEIQAIEAEMSFTIPEDVEEVVIANVEEQTGKPVSQSVLDAINRKVSGMNNEALRLVIQNELKSFVPENWSDVENWLKANFPNLPVYRVKNLIKATNGRQAWGMFQDGALYIYENAEVGTVYHEVFHAVWRMFSNPAEQKSVMDEMRNRGGKFFDRKSLKDINYSEATADQLEEKLAEEFRDYVQFKKIPPKPSKGRPFIVKLFADMVTAIKELFVGPQAKSKTEKLFKKIGEGYYKSHIPYQTSLAYAKTGVIDIEDAFATSDAALSLFGISDKERSDIIQHMTYLTLVDLIKTDRSLFEVPNLNKKEQYAKLKDQIQETVAQKIKAAQSLVSEGVHTQEEVNPIILSTVQLMQNIEDQWNEITERHEEYLKGYNIEFDENDVINLRDENNTGRSDYQDATKIDNFKKANSAIKLLLATIPEVNNDGSIQPSSIGGATLLPIGKTFISVMNNLHTSSSVEDMVNRLRIMAANDPNYRTLYRRITKRDWKDEGVDFSKIDTPHGLQLLSSIWRTFKKQNPDVRNVFILENGDVVVGEANLSTAAQQLKNEYVNAIVFKARSGEGFFTYDEKEKAFKGDPKKIAGVKLDSATAMVDFLNRMGIPFTVPSVNKMTPAQQKLFRDAVAGIKESISKTEKIATFSGKALSIDKRLFQLALLQSAIENPEFSSTYFNISGERTQSFIGTNAASDLSEFLSGLQRFNNQTVGGTKYKYLLTDSFAKGSNLLSRMFTSVGTRKEGTEDLFKIGYVGGTTNEAKGKRKESSKLTYRDRLVQELNLNLSGWYLNLVPGDASIEWMINMGNAISTSSLGRGMTDINEIFKAYFIAELTLARENRPVAKGRDANELRFFRDILGKELQNDILSDKNAPEKVYERFASRINGKLESFIKTDTNKLKTVLSQYGIIKEGAFGIELDNINLPKNLSEKELDNHLTTLSVNYMIANIEMHKLLFSDPYQYEDELKRIKSFLSPRQAIINSSPKMNTALNNIWNRGYKAGDIGHTKFTQDYFRSATHADVIGVINLPGYEEFKETDGSGIISFKALRQFRIRAGEWNDNEERQFRYDIAWEKRDKNLSLTKEEVETLKAGNPEVKSAYTPIKPIVSGARLDQNGMPANYNNVVLDKFALYPLSYRILREMETESNAINLYNKMQREDVDYIVFNTGRKVGAEKNPHATYNEDGSFNDTPYIKENVINVPFSIMSIQAEVPSKEDNLVTRGSQITKLITMDFMEAGVPVDFFPGQQFNSRYKAWYKLSPEERLEKSELYREIKNNQDILGALIEQGYKNTLDKLGIQEKIVKDKEGVITKEYSITDFSKAAQTLREEILKREVNDNISDALAGFLQGRTILEATPAYQQVRNIIYSIADKEFISPKINGGLKVQIPSTLFEQTRTKITEINGKKGYTSDVLKMYEKDGKRVAEVMLGRWFDSPLSDDELLDYLNNTEEGQKILAGIGFRIPTQKQNSVDVIVVKKFLPKEFGDSVVIPAALVQKVGSDFDIDKLSVYLKNVYIKNGKPKMIPYVGTGAEAIQKLTEMYDKGEFLTDEEMKELDRYIAEEELLLQDVAESSPEGKLMSAIFGKMFSEEEITSEFTRGIPSREQIINRLYKKSLENAYIQSMENLVSHPSNYENLIKPNSADPLKKLGKEIAEKTIGQTFDYKNVTNMLDRTFMSRLRHAFVTGKYAIGIAAVNQTNHSLNQRQPIYVDKSKMNLLSDEDKFWVGNGDVKFSQYNTIEINGRMVPTLSMIENKAGESISDIVGMFIDGYVDISKGPWIMELGATPNVASTWLFLVKLGVPVKTVAYFMNQPIIRDYLRTVESAGYSWLFIDQFVEQMGKEYGITMEEAEYNQRAAAFSIPGETALKNNVGKPTSEFSPQQKMEQYMMLREFLKYAKMAEHMFIVTQGSNYDTATFNDPYLVFKKQMQQVKAQNTMISSVDDILGKSFVGSLASTIKDVREAFSKILTSDQKNIRNVIEKVLTPYIGMNDREFVKLAQKAVNDLFDWAVQNDQQLNNMIQDILINDGGVGKEVMTFVNQVKKDRNHPLYNNHIINILEGIPSRRAEKGGANNVKLKLADTKVYDQNNVIYAFRELRDYLKGENNPLYERIKLLAVLQSGLSASPISFTSLLPHEDFEKIYGQTLSKINSIANLNDFYELGVFQRNNWNNDDITPYLRAKLIYGKTGIPHYNPSMKFLPEAVKQAVEKNDIPPVMTLSKYNREANSDYIVYTWEKESEILTEEDKKNNVTIKQKKAQMRKAGDYSFINKGLFKKVYDDYNTPLETTDYSGKPYFVYKAINAWGDSFRANEFWPTDHKSVIENGFIKVEDVDNNVIISKFLEGKKAQPAAGKIAATPKGTMKLKDGVTYGFSAINSKMLEAMKYTPQEISNILKSIC